MAWSKKPLENSNLASEINMIPLIDVMLVLLIIFLLTAPLLTHSIPVNLPDTQANSTMTIEEVKPIEITIQADGSLYFQEQLVNREILQQQISEVAQLENPPAIHLRSDESVAYKVVAQIIADINQAGVKQVGLISK